MQQQPQHPFSSNPMPSAKWMALAAAILVLSIAGLIYDNWEIQLQQDAPEQAAQTTVRNSPERPRMFAEAQYAEGRAHMQRGDWAKAVPFWEKAAAEGHPKALNNLAVAYLEGRGVKRNTVLGCRLMEQAAGKTSDPRTWANLGMCIEDLPKPDYAKAAEAYRKAAALGFTEAETALEKLYEDGKVERR